MPSVELDVDLGELEGEPEELYGLATLVNVACGGHAGDLASMRRAIRAARAARARIAAHPSYADREGFGRRRGHASTTQVRAQLEAQCRELAAIAEDEGAPIVALKPHGALYHDASADPDLAEAVSSVAGRILGPSTVVVGPAGGHLERVALAAGLPFAREVFADRGTLPDGSLVPRGAPGALLTDPAAAAAQAVALVARGGAEAVCVHGDTPGAVEIARAVRDALEVRGWLRPRA